MRNLKVKITKPLLLIIISAILMLIIGTTGTLELLGKGTVSLSLTGAIIFAGLMGCGIFSLLINVFREVFFIAETSRNFKGKIIKSGKYVVVILFTLIITLVAVLGTMLIYWNIRLPPSYETDPVLQLETYTAIPTGNQLEKHHKSNTKLYYWKGNFYLTYQSSKWHLEDKNGELIIAKSPDASEGSWEIVASIKGPGQNDVRDPLITEINGRLFFYFLPNFRFDPGPNTTYWTVSNDGETWIEPQELEVNVLYEDGWKTEAGWVFGRQRPLTEDNITWYVMASGRKNNKRMTILLESTDGINWMEVSVVYDTYGSGEACMEFLPNGEFISTLRVSAMSSWTGYEFGTPHAGTIIATSYNNHRNWSHHADFQTRMDGATLFTLNNRSRIFVAGRNHLGPRIDIGNHVSRKRTAIYEVTKDHLIHLFDLPSNGDTAYTGVVVRGDDIFVSYYTCPINKDYPWIVGICIQTETEIRMAKFSASGLIQYANQFEGG